MEPVMVINPQVRKSYNKTIDIDNIPVVECEAYEYENSNLRISFKILAKELYRANLTYCKEQMQAFTNEVKNNQAPNVVLI